MARGWALAAVVAVVVVTLPGSAGAKPRDHRPPLGLQDGPRLLAEALRSGDTDLAAWATVVRWVLTEKEETVAAAFAQVLGDMPVATEGAEAERWDATTRAVLGAFQGVLQDAQDHHRRGGDEIARGLATVAGPAVIAALQQADPAALDGMAGVLGALAPSAREMVGPLAGALRDSDRSIRLGAATLLGAMGPSAQAARADLEKAREDPDPRVREAVASALRHLAPE